MMLKASSSERGSKWKQYFDFKRKYLIASNITNSNGKILFSRDLDYGLQLLLIEHKVLLIKCICRY